MPAKKAEWKTTIFKMYYLEYYGMRRGLTPMLRDVPGHGIVRWKTQRKGKYMKKLMDMKSQATIHVPNAEVGIEELSIDRE